MDREDGDGGRGYWRIRTRAIHYEYAGRKFCPINLSARFLLSCLFIERTLYLYPSIYPSAGMSESTNQALMHAKCAEEKLIVIHVPLPFSRVSQHGDVRPVSSSSSSRVGWKNKFQDELAGPYQSGLLTRLWRECAYPFREAKQISILSK